MARVPESPTSEIVVEESVGSKGKEKEKEHGPIKKFRGVPENVQLFEVFWKQVIELIKVCSFQFVGEPIFLIKCSINRPSLTCRYKMFLVSLTNLSLSCYPDRLEYVDQILGFAAEKIKGFSDRWEDEEVFYRCP
jgi:vacuolar protein sorting-associated protein 35